VFRDGGELPFAYFNGIERLVVERDIHGHLSNVDSFKRNILASFFVIERGLVRDVLETPVFQ